MTEENSQIRKECDKERGKENMFETLEGGLKNIKDLQEVICAINILRDSIIHHNDATKSIAERKVETLSTNLLEKMYERMIGPICHTTDIHDIFDKPTEHVDKTIITKTEDKDDEKTMIYETLEPGDILIIRHENDYTYVLENKDGNARYRKVKIEI